MSREAAVRAAVGVAEEHGIACSEPRVLADGANVLVHLAPAPVVARVPATVAGIRPDGGLACLVREVAVAGHLVAAGAPVVGPSPLLPPGPHRRDGRWLTFARWREPVPGPPVVIEEAAEALAALHLALDGFDAATLPSLEPVLGEVPRVVTTLDGASPLPASDRAALLEGVAAIRSELERLPAEAWRAVHGDAHPGNLLRTADGLRWSDFEDACRAPRAWDLACLAFSGSAFGATAGGEDAPGFAACLDGRALQAAAWTSWLAALDPAYVEPAAVRMAWCRERFG